MTVESVDYIVLAIPVFIALMLAEIAYSSWTGRGLYRLGDSVANIGCGMVEQVFGVFVKAAAIRAYVWVYERSGWLKLPSESPWTWAVAFVGADFCYYWWHRASHEVNFLWAAHAVHHQSEEYNLSVALRQGAVTQLSSIPFYFPLAVLGVPPIPYLGAKSFMILYQFWIHTRVIDRMGWLEKVLNTPSHHRVHHGINPVYLDKNYAGTFIIWDRWFGSFREEREPVVYGTVKPLGSWNAIWAQVQYWVEIVERSRSASRWRDRVWAWFAHPAWRPAEQGGWAAPPEVSVESFRKYAPEAGSGNASRARSIYVLVQFALAVIGASIFLNFANRLSSPWVFAGAAWILSTLAILAGLLERRRWAWAAELGRLAALGAGVSVFLIDP